MENFNFFTLLRKQYSWKNDRISLLFVSVYSLFHLVVLSPIGEEITAAVLVYLIITSLGLSMYHCVKLLVSGTACAFVTWYANKGSTKAAAQYIKMLTWRQ